MDVLVFSESDEKTRDMLSRHMKAVDAAQESGDQPTIDAAEAALGHQLEAWAAEKGLDPVVDELRRLFFSDDPDEGG